jgi:hypothetical protein
VTNHSIDHLRHQLLSLATYLRDHAHGSDAETIDALSFVTTELERAQIEASGIAADLAECAGKGNGGA